MQASYILADEEATRTIAQAIGRVLPKKAICLFEGPMAVGKTTFIQSLAEGMGLCRAEVTSPTYTLANLYENSEVSLVHVDFYRLPDSDSVRALAEEDWLNPRGVTAIEWPEVARPLLRSLACLTFSLQAPDPESEILRRLHLSAEAPLYAPIFDHLSSFQR